MQNHVMISLCDGILNRFDPLGARCIMGVIERKGGVFVALLQDRLISREDIIKQAIALNPFGMWISVQPETLGLLDFLKELSGKYDGPIIIGNVGARGLLKDELNALRSNIVIVVGQGEDSAIKLYDLLLKKNRIFYEDDLKLITNLRFLDSEGELFETETKPSMLAKSAAIPSEFGLLEAIARDDVITARSSSGCHFSCVFCTVKDINNGQRWVGHNPESLKKYIRMVVKNGMRDGTIRLVDDDLAGDIQNVKVVSETFHEINQEYGVNISFGFATRASHFANLKDTEEQAEKRIAIWNYAVSVGLQNVFLGLESGSTTQLRRLGKSTKAESNFKAASIALSLNVNLEIGFIPIDPFMENVLWRTEMRDNIRLARHVDAAKTSPTWLAPMRAYEGSPIVTWLRKKNLLRERIENTDEYAYEYVSTEVVRFIELLGPAFCDGKNNGLYDLKREIKNVQRYPFGLNHRIQNNCDEIIYAEIKFVETLLDMDLNCADILKEQNQYINVLEENINEILLQIQQFEKKQFTSKILNCCKEAMNAVQLWKENINAQNVTTINNNTTCNSTNVLSARDRLQNFQPKPIGLVYP